MKFSINSKYKLWVILTVAVLVVGFVLVAIFGFNQTVDYKDSYEVVVTGNSQVAQADLKESAQKYFEDNKITTVDYATETFDGPIANHSVVFKFDKDVKIDKADMQNFIKEDLGIASNQMAEVTVEYNKVHSYYDNEIGFIILALALGGLASFIYLLFVEKLASAVASISSAVLASVLFIALMGATRIPAEPFAMATCVGAFALSMLLSVGLVNRFKEEARLNDAVESSKDKLNYVQIADKSANASLLRYSFVAGAIFVLSIIFITAGSVYIKFLGLQLLLAGICAICSSFVGVPLLWPVLKNCKKK